LCDTNKIVVPFFVNWRILSEHLDTSKKVHLFIGLMDTETNNYAAEVTTRYFVDTNLNTLNQNHKGLNVYPDEFEMNVSVNPLCLFNGTYKPWVMVVHASDKLNLETICEYKLSKSFFAGVKKNILRKDVTCSLPVKSWNSSASKQNVSDVGGRYSQSRSYS